jgi:penicillin-insensitive murein endopeptidase
VLRPRSALVALAALLVPAIAAGAPTPKRARPPAEKQPHANRTARLAPASSRQAPGKSIGSPTEGHLVGGARLAEAPHIRIFPVYVAGDARWGLEPLVQMIDHAARAVRKQYPDAVLSVGELSRSGGGEIDRHASHESGRDADIGFYVKNQQGKGIYADHFVPFKADGTAASWPGAQLDDAKNWAFVAAVASAPRARVSHIFVASPIRARLLSYAERVGAPPAIRARAAELMAQPRGSLPHDDHFHIRIACPSGMDRCIEQPLAKKRARGSAKAAVASASSPAGAHGAAKAHAPAPGAAPQRPAPAPAKPEPASSEEAESKSEAFVPNLAPMVPGLDAAVIAAPLAGAKADKPAPPSEPAPIDDPDGVLEPSR